MGQRFPPINGVRFRAHDEHSCPTRAHIMKASQCPMRPHISAVFMQKCVGRSLAS